MRFALIALLIVGACSGSGGSDVGSSTQTSNAPSQQSQQAAHEPGHPAQVTLYWDPVTQLPVDGYRIHYGLQSRLYTVQVDTGNVTSWTVQNLATGTYYFAVTAVKAGHAESGYSNEVSATILGGH